MKFQTVRIYFLSEFWDFLPSKNFATMATWRNDFSSLCIAPGLQYLLYSSMYLPVNQTLEPNPFDLHA